MSDARCTGLCRECRRRVPVLAGVIAEHRGGCLGVGRRPTWGTIEYQPGFVEWATSRTSEGKFSSEVRRLHPGEIRVLLTDLESLPNQEANQYVHQRLRALRKALRPVQPASDQPSRSVRTVSGGLPTLGQR